MLAVPLVCRAQAPAPTPGSLALEAALEGANPVIDGRWEVTLDGRIGFPIGRLKVGEFPTGSNRSGGGGTPGTLLRLHTLGIDVSEALRSEEHTSELQSQSNLVCRLLLEKKKKNERRNEK